MNRADSLKRKKEFRHTYRVGKSQTNRLLVAVYCLNRQQKTYVGFSVSKKIGNAVTRNRVKRRMREAVTPMIPDLKQGYNIIIIAKFPVVEASFTDIQDSLHSVFCKAGLLKTVE